MHIKRYDPVAPRGCKRWEVYVHDTSMNKVMDIYAKDAIEAATLFENVYAFLLAQYGMTYLLEVRTTRYLGPVGPNSIYLDLFPSIGPLTETYPQFYPTKKGQLKAVRCPRILKQGLYAGKRPYAVYSTDGISEDTLFLRYKIASSAQEAIEVVWAEL